MNGFRLTISFVLIYHIGRIGQSKRFPDLDHAVVYYNGKEVHDPGKNTGIVGNPEYFIIFALKDPAKIIR